MSCCPACGGRGCVACDTTGQVPAVFAEALGAMCASGILQPLEPLRMAAKADVDKLRGHSLPGHKGGDADTLRDYWAGHPTKHGKVSGITWGFPGDFDQCVARVSKFMLPDRAKGFCALRHHQATGAWPGHAPAEEAAKKAGSALKAVSQDQKHAEPGVLRFNWAEWDEARKAAKIPKLIRANQATDLKGKTHKLDWSKPGGGGVSAVHGEKTSGLVGKCSCGWVTSGSEASVRRDFTDHIRKSSGFNELHFAGVGKEVKKAAKAGWDEAKHPRGHGGKFVSKFGSGKAEDFEPGDAVKLKNGLTGWVQKGREPGYPKVATKGMTLGNPVTLGQTVVSPGELIHTSRANFSRRIDKNLQKAQGIAGSPPLVTGPWSPIKGTEAAMPITCPTCVGIGKTVGGPCPDCTGRGQVSVQLAEALATRDAALKLADLVKCPTCSGSGKILAGHRTCPSCKGKGSLTPQRHATLKAAGAFNELHFAEPGVLTFDWAKWDAAHKGLSAAKKAEGEFTDSVGNRHAKKSRFVDSAGDYIEDGDKVRFPSQDSLDRPGTMKTGQVYSRAQHPDDPKRDYLSVKTDAGSPGLYYTESLHPSKVTKVGGGTAGHFVTDAAGNKVGIRGKYAELDADARNSLNAPDFAYTGDDGTGHFPVHDAAHVRSALSRFTQHQFPDAGTKQKAAKKIKAKAKQFGIDVGDDTPVAQAANMSEPWVVALPFSEVAAASFKEGVPLPFLKIGEHHFADYGDVNIGDDELDRVVENFHANVRRQDTPIINEEHIPATYDEGKPVMGPGAVGYIKDLYRDGDTVYAVPDWNSAGERLMADDRYRGTSPELMLNWTDPESLEQHGLTAVGLALTNRPRMKNLASQGKPLAASEGRVLAFAESADVHIDQPLSNLSVAYAFPDQRRLPLHSPEAVKGALARFAGIQASEDDRDQAWQRIRDAGKDHGVQVPDSWRQLKASEVSRWLMADGATEASVQSAPSDQSTKETEMADEDDNVEEQEVEPTEAESAQPAEERVSEPADDRIPSPADFAEMQVMYRAQAQQLHLAEQAIQELRAARDRAESTRKLSEAQHRVDALVRSGRITPAAVEKMAPQMAKFAEDGAMLDVLEALPANSAVPLHEIGTSQERGDHVNDTQAHHEAALAYMREKGQDTDMRKRGFSENYAQALRDTATVGIGYSPR